MISKEEVQHIAKLARLELTPQEVEKMQQDLTAILDYFDVLQKAPKVKVGKQSVSKFELNQSRNDVVAQRSASLAYNLVEAAPDKKDGYIKVKSIL